MDVLASFFASNYALYANNTGQYGVMYPPTGVPPQHMAHLFHPYIHHAIPGSIPRPVVPVKPKTSKTKEDVKFSIDNILNDSTKTCKNGDDDESDNDELVVDENSEKDSDEQKESSEQFSWLQCTRYRPPKLPRLKKKDGIKKRKLGRNPRVPFTQHQVAVLEQKFRRTHYLSSMDVAELSTALNLTENRVKIWFQNRRARERRDRESIQRNQMLQSRHTAATGTPDWSYPVVHDALVQFRDSVPTTLHNSVFTPISTASPTMSSSVFTPVSTEK